MKLLLLTLFAITLRAASASAQGPMPPCIGHASQAAKNVASAQYPGRNIEEVESDVAGSYPNYVVWRVLLQIGNTSKNSYDVLTQVPTCRIVQVKPLIGAGGVQCCHMNCQTGQEFCSQVPAGSCVHRACH
jgi:hypothetical protein